MPAAARTRARRASSKALRERDLVFRALADETRRELLVLLAREPQSVHALAARFAVSRPAISRHLGVLRRAGLVREEKVGRERVYTLEQGPLEEVAQYVAAVEAFWQQGLEDLGKHLDRAAAARPRE